MPAMSTPAEQRSVCGPSSRTLTERFADPAAPERELLELPLSCPADLLALAGRPDLPGAVRARVHRAAVALADMWRTDPAELLIAAITASGTTRAELLTLAGSFKVLRTSLACGQVVVTLAGQPGCDDEVLATALVDLRAFLPTQTWAETWEATLLTLGDVDPAAELAARLFGRSGPREVPAMRRCLTEARRLDAAGRKVASSLLTQSPVLPPTQLLTAAAGVAA